MYLAGLDPNVAMKPVLKLASCPWFLSSGIPPYDSGVHGRIDNYMQTYAADFLRSWPGRAPTAPDEVERIVRSTIEHPIELGCELVILPAPLTTVAADNFEPETLWMDIGLRVCEERRVSVPIFATVALSDNLRGPLFSWGSVAFVARA
jgi:hypothetical protein